MDNRQIKNKKVDLENYKRKYGEENFILFFNFELIN